MTLEQRLDLTQPRARDQLGMPCPSCGFTLQLFTNGHLSALDFVFCTNCSSMLPRMQTKKEMLT